MIAQEEKQEEKSNVKELRVSGSSAVEKTASAIVRFIQDGYFVTLSMIGANAVNQAVKAVIKANSFSAPSGFILSMVPFFKSTEIEGNETSIIKMNISRNEIYGRGTDHG